MPPPQCPPHKHKIWYGLIIPESISAPLGSTQSLLPSAHGNWHCTMQSRLRWLLLFTCLVWWVTRDMKPHLTVIFPTERLMVPAGTRTPSPSLAHQSLTFYRLSYLDQQKTCSSADSSFHSWSIFTAVIVYAVKTIETQECVSFCIITQYQKKPALALNITFPCLKNQNTFSSCTTLYFSDLTWHEYFIELGFQSEIIINMSRYNVF